jgi:AcrR family transcriptional regulator
VAKPAHDPRANQKQRTRAAIVDAAVRLVREGATPTVAQAAEVAGVSRATAYRYFPTPEDLLIEVATVTPAVQPVEAVLAELGDDADPETRFVRVQETFNDVVVQEEAQMRTALRAYLDHWLARRQRGVETGAELREGRRMRWLGRILEPARGTLSPKQRRRLECALALTLGMDGMVVMKDVCRLKDDEAQDVLRWAGLVLLRAGLAEARRGRSESPRVRSRPVRGRGRTATASRVK